MDPKNQKRMDELAQKVNDDTATDDEREEFAKLFHQLVERFDNSLTHA